MILYLTIKLLHAIQNVKLFMCVKLCIFCIDVRQKTKFISSGNYQGAAQLWLWLEMQCLISLSDKL